MTLTAINSTSDLEATHPRAGPSPSHSAKPELASSHSPNTFASSYLLIVPAPRCLFFSVPFLASPSEHAIFAFSLWPTTRGLLNRPRYHSCHFFRRACFPIFSRDAFCYAFYYCGPPRTRKSVSSNGFSRPRGRLAGGYPATTGDTIHSYYVI